MERSRTSSFLTGLSADPLSPWRAHLGSSMGTRYRWVIWVTISIQAFYQNLQTFAYPVLVPALLAELSLSYSMAGGLMSVYVFSMAAVMLPIGLLADRFGGRLLVVGGLLCMTVGTGLFALATSYPMAVLSRVLIGLGAAVAIVMPAPLLAQWFSKAQYRSVLGVHVSVGKTGSILATWVLAPLISALGWRLGYGVVSLIGPVAVLAAFVFLANRPEDVGYSGKQSFAVPRSQRKLPAKPANSIPLRQVLANRNLLLIASAQFFLFCTYFGSINWLPTYFTTEAGLGEVEAGVYTGFTLWGTIVGFALSGPAANYLGRCLPLYTGGLGGTTLLVAMFANGLLPTLPAWSWVPILFLFGITLSPMVLLMPIMVTFVPEKALATANGFAFTLAYLGAVIAPPLIGAIADSTGSLAFALWVAVVSAALGFGVSLFVREGSVSG